MKKFLDSLYKQVSNFSYTKIIQSLNHPDFFGTKYNLDKLKNEMIAHLEAKYNKKFLPILLEPRGFQIEYDKLRVYPAGGDKETDVAHIGGSSTFGEKVNSQTLK